MLKLKQNAFNLVNNAMMYSHAKNVMMAIFLILQNHVLLVPKIAQLANGILRFLMLNVHNVMKISK